MYIVPEEKASSGDEDDVEEEEKGLHRRIIHPIFVGWIYWLFLSLKLRQWMTRAVDLVRRIL